MLALGTLSYLVLLTMLMGGMYLAIDATAGERERGSLEPLLTVPVPREQLIYGKILATCAYMTLSLTLTVTAFAIVLRFTGLERFGMSVNFGPRVALAVILLMPAAGAAGRGAHDAGRRTTPAAIARRRLISGLVLLVPTLPLVFAGTPGPAAARSRSWPCPRSASISSSRACCAMSRCRAGYVALSVGATLALGGAAHRRRRAASTGARRCSAERRPAANAAARACLVRELARLDLEAVVPVAAPQALEQVARAR